MGKTDSFFIKKYLDKKGRYLEGSKSMIIRKTFGLGSKYGFKKKNCLDVFSFHYLNSLEEIPEPNSGTIILPWRTDSWLIYEKGYYDEAWFDGESIDYKVTKEELDGVFKDLKEDPNWVAQLGFPFLLYIALLSVPLFFFVLTLLVIINGQTEHPAIYYGLIVSCPIFGILTLIAPFYVYYSNLQRLKNREKNFDKIFESWNQRVFSSRGLNFKSGKYGAWVAINLQEPNMNLLEHINQVNTDILENIREEYNEEAEKVGVEKLPEGTYPDNDTKGCFFVKPSNWMLPENKDYSIKDSLNEPLME